MLRFALKLSVAALMLPMLLLPTLQGPARHDLTNVNCHPLHAHNWD